MLSKILTSCVASIDDFIRNPYGMLNNVTEGSIAIFINNAPAFYVISSQRLAQLLKSEIHLTNLKNNLEVDNQFYKKQLLKCSLTTPTKKFSMYQGWQPDDNFQRIATLWGVFLAYPVMSEELAKFISYWKSEKTMLYHVQWQQKLARSIQINRTKNTKYQKYDIHYAHTPEFSNQIPPGFRG